MTVVTLDKARIMTEHYIDANQPVFIWGPPGVGKSEMVSTIAKGRKKWNLIDFRASLRDAVDLRGIPDLDRKSKTTVWYAPDELPQEARDGKQGILFLDEMNVAPQQVQAALYGLVLDRKLGEYYLPKGWRIVAAGNRQGDRAAAQRMPTALANRFGHIEVEADAEVWIRDYALEHCHPLLSGLMRFRKDLIWGFDGDDEIRFRSPRSWAKASKHIEAPDSVRRDLIAGLVGEGGASECEGFIRVWRDLPDLDEIEAKPTKAPVPEDPSALYAVSTALGRRAETENFDAIMTYARRLGQEYEIIVCMDATSKNEILTKTKTYIDFTMRNKHLKIGKYAA